MSDLQRYKDIYALGVELQSPQLIRAGRQYILYHVEQLCTHCGDMHPLADYYSEKIGKFNPDCHDCGFENGVAEDVFIAAIVVPE